MGDEKLDPFIGIPKTLTGGHHPDLRHSHVLTYLAVRSFASLEPANEYFSRCFPLIATIRAVYGQSRSTVFAGLRWLESHDYLYRCRAYKQRASSEYTLILWRDWFREIQQSEGRAEAIRRYEARLLDMQAEARVARAKQARDRAGDDQSSRASRERGSKYAPADHSPEEVRYGDLDRCADRTSTPGCTQIKIQEKGRSRVEDQDSGTPPVPEAHPSCLQTKDNKLEEPRSVSPEECREGMKEFVEKARNVRAMVEALAKEKVFPE